MNEKKKMRIGVGAPCHVKDKPFVHDYITALNEMSPGPDARFIYVNDGSEGLGVARKKVFDKLFYERGCDVVLMASIDFFLFPDILRHVDPARITGFGYLVKKPATVVSLVKRMFSRYAWTGVYSMPKHIWAWFKRTPWAHNWDGEASPVQWFALDEGVPIKIVRTPKYWVIRYSERMKEYAADLGGLKAVLKLMDAW